jgi:hypothetical protein
MLTLGDLHLGLRDFGYFDKLAASVHERVPQRAPVPPVTA